MSEVTTFISKDLENSHRVKVSMVNGDLNVYDGIQSLGFSSDETNLLLLFNDSDSELPSVLINTDNIAYVEIDNAGIHDSEGTDRAS